MRCLRAGATPTDREAARLRDARIAKRFIATGTDPRTVPATACRACLANTGDAAIPARSRVRKDADAIGCAGPDVRPAGRTERTIPDGSLPDRSEHGVLVQLGATQSHLGRSARRRLPRRDRRSRDRRTTDEKPRQHPHLSTSAHPALPLVGRWPAAHPKACSQRSAPRRSTPEAARPRLLSWPPRVISAVEAPRPWWVARSSKPLWGPSWALGGFDSPELPPYSGRPRPHSEAGMKRSRPVAPATTSATEKRNA